MRSLVPVCRGLAVWRLPKRSRHSGVGAGVNIQVSCRSSLITSSIRDRKYFLYFTFLCATNCSNVAFKARSQNITSAPPSSDSTQEAQPEALGDQISGAPRETPKTAPDIDKGMVEEPTTADPKATEELNRKLDQTIVNATYIEGIGALPSYAINGPNTKFARRLSFHLSDARLLTAYDQDSKTLWEVDAKKFVTSGWEVQSEIAGGFDFDTDGVPDIFFISKKTTGSCGATFVANRRIHFVSGRTGNEYGEIISPMADKCFSNLNYSTVQISQLSILWGPNASSLLFLPYYATQGRMYRNGVAPFASKGSDYLYYPSTASYDYYYQYDSLNAHGGGTSFEELSHVANGLLLKVGDQERAVFFTTARVVQYHTSSFWSGQLISDRTFLPGGRTDLLGRNYGIIARDPASPDNLFLITGTSNFSVQKDRIETKRSTDRYAGIERHITRYNLRNSSLNDRFFSYAHDPAGTDGNLYENRISYPSNPFVPVAGSASRLAFNVFGGGRWNLHVTTPGNISSQKIMPDLLLWDVIKWGTKGESLWLTSPTMTEPGASSAGKYFPEYRTEVRVWDEENREAKIIATLQGVIPKLLPRFFGEERVSSQGELRSPAIVRDSKGKLSMVALDRDGNEKLVPWISP